MIISQAPYRVSLAGGGTDLPAFSREEAGAVLSIAIARHMYVTVSPRFDETTRVAYTRTEIASTIDEIDHDIAREALRLTELGRHLEITTIGDVPAGTGLGSSSSLTVGLLQALYAYRGEIVSAQRLAEEACRIEIDVLGKPIGRQDQYAAAFGGVNYIRFHPDDTVDVEPVPITAATVRELESRVLTRTYAVPQTLREADEADAEERRAAHPPRAQPFASYAKAVIEGRFEPVLAKGTMGVYRAALRAWSEYFGPRDGRRAASLDAITPSAWADYRAWRASMSSLVLRDSEPLIEPLNHMNAAG